MVRLERLLLHKGDANNVFLSLSHIVLQRNTDIVYRVPYRAVFIAMYRSGPNYMIHTIRNTPLTRRNDIL